MTLLRTIPALAAVFVAGFVFRTYLFGLGVGADVARLREAAGLYGLVTVMLLVTALGVLAGTLRSKQ